MAQMEIRVEKMTQVAGNTNNGISKAFVVIFSGVPGSRDVVASGLTDSNGLFKCETGGKVNIRVFAEGYRLFSRDYARAENMTIKMIALPGSARTVLLTTKGIALVDHNGDGKIDESDAPDIAMDKHKMAICALRDDVSFTTNQTDSISMGRYDQWLNFTVNVGKKHIKCENIADLNGEPCGRCVVLSVKADLTTWPKGEGDKTKPPVRKPYSLGEVGRDIRVDRMGVEK